METRSWFRILTAVAGAQYEALLDYAVARRGHYTTFLFVQRMRTQFDPTANALIEALEPQLVATVESDRWPGTQLAGDTALVRFYRLERRSATVLKRLESLEAWLAPRFPEDLCVLAADKAPWLVSKTREGRFFLHLTEEEHRALGSSLPWLQLEKSPEP